MKRKFFYFLMFFVIATVGVSFVSCGDDDDDETNGGGTPSENELVGYINGKRELDPSVEYFLTGSLIVEEGGELHIPAGTVIKSRKGFKNYILVLQGGKIFANGTPEKPVKMTADIDTQEEGYWGGLVINGKAPLTKDDEGEWTTGSTEIYSAHAYGGSDPNDNSGVLTYLILSNTGARSSANIEHNGLTLNGVGKGTKIENIFIPYGADDAIEFFGGSVDVTNLLVLNSDDDMFDFTQGYNGTLKNAYGIWDASFSSSEADPRGIEADGNLDGEFPDHTEQSNFRVENMTIDIRVPANKADTRYQMMDVIKVRRGAKATIVNALVKGTTTVGHIIDMEGADQTSDISLTSLLDEDNVKEEELIYPETGFPNVKIEAGNAGCPTNIFGWTGYSDF